MELKPGYKQTEVGVIPVEWDIKLLRDLAQIKSGIAKNSNIAVADPILVHYLRVANVQDGFLDLSEMSCIQISRRDLNRYSVLPGDVLMNEGGDLDKLGRGSIWQGDFNPCIHQNHVFVVRCSSSLIPEYLNTWSSAASARHYFLITGKQTTNLASINKTALGQLPIALPPLPEQRAIAAALSDVDALLGGLDRLIAKKRDIKQATMQQLLTGKTRLPGFSGNSKFKQTDVGVIPIDWRVEKIGEISTVGRGRVISHREIASVINALYPVYSSQTSNNGIMGYLDTFQFEGEYLTWTTDGANAGTVFHRIGKFNCTNVCGTIKLKSDSAAFVSRVLSKIAPNYVSRNLGNPKLMNDIMKKISVPLPSLAEQKAIAEILSDMDEELAALEEKREKTRALKQGMMQALLTGRVRLV